MRLVIAIATLLCALQGFAQAAEYKVAPERSELVVQLYKAGIASALAHDHVIRAAEFSGDAEFNPDDPSLTSLRIEVQTASLQADEPELRRKYGLTQRLSDGDRKSIQQTMESPRQMDAQKYPTITFQSTEVKKESEGLFLITGDLTMHGVTRTVTVSAIIEDLKNGDIRGRASLTFNQSDFDIEPYSAFLGAVRNQDQAVMHVNILITPVPPDDPPAD
jgi:polyisoprenoid-binding protein YceI